MGGWRGGCIGILSRSKVCFEVGKGQGGRLVCIKHGARARVGLERERGRYGDGKEKGMNTE